MFNIPLSAKFDIENIIKVYHLYKLTHHINPYYSGAKPLADRLFIKFKNLLLTRLTSLKQLSKEKKA